MKSILVMLQLIVDIIIIAFIIIFDVILNTAFDWSVFLTIVFIMNIGITLCIYYSKINEEKNIASMLNNSDRFMINNYTPEEISRGIINSTTIISIIFGLMIQCYLVIHSIINLIDRENINSNYTMELILNKGNFIIKSAIVFLINALLINFIIRKYGKIQEKK